ncbi:MAG: hypothetical protein ACPGOW_10265, partial [Paracoccaceae bacterium]
MRFCAAVITRIQTYRLPVSENTALYIQRIRQHPSVKNGVKTQLNGQFIAILKTPIGSTEKICLLQHRFIFEKAKSLAFCVTSRSNYAAAVKERIELCFDYFCPSPCP